MKIGEVRVGRVGGILKATLGSCVGIGFYWRERELSGLAHCLLPQAPLPSTAISAKYVSQAIPSLMAMMKITPKDIPHIEVYVAGGGNMLEYPVKRTAPHIGALNTAQAENALRELGFTIKKIETGGAHGRQICLNCSSGEVEIKKILKSA